MRIISIVLACIVIPLTATPQERPADRLRKAIVEEEANRNPQKAIEGYRQIVKEYDEARDAAATAMFRLAEQLRRTGKSQEAERLYTRVAREFGDRAELARASREHLSGPVLEDLEMTRPHVESDARSGELTNQKRQIEFRLQQLQQKLAAEQRQVEAGGVRPDDRRLQELKEKISETLAQRSQLDVLREGGRERDNRAAIEAEYAHRKAEYEALQVQHKMLQQRIEGERQKVQVGVVEQNSDAMLKLQKQLAESEASQADAAARVERLAAERNKIAETERLDRTAQLTTMQNSRAFLQRQIADAEARVKAGVLPDDNATLRQLRTKLAELEALIREAEERLAATKR